MSIRIKLANWISGGELSAWRAQAVEAQMRVIDMEGFAWAYEDALNEIIALETPRCAHIGKRMARIAREAQEGGQ